MRSQTEMRGRGGKQRKSVTKVDPNKVRQAARLKMQDKLEEVREKKTNNVVTQKRTSTRIAERFKPDTKPTLSFRSNYKGVPQQDRYAEQAIGFEQIATLKWDAGAPSDIASYFELRQYVCDEIKYAEYDSVVRDWELDGPYHPPYEDPQTSADKTSITFTDEPGFSSTGSRADNRKVLSGWWLEFYTVSFYWEVTRLDTQEVWQSPVVTHSMTSAPNANWSNAPVIAAAAGNRNWEVNLTQV